MKFIYTAFMLLLIAFGCRKSEWNVRDTPDDLSELRAFEAALNIPTWNLPVYAPRLPYYLVDLGMKNIEIDSKKAALGRILFYDKSLSKDASISCASCHDPQRAFSDNVNFSLGVGGNHAARNSSPLANTAVFKAHYNEVAGTPLPRLFWDNRVQTVSDQARQSFANPLEMGVQMDEVVGKIKSIDYYPWIWKQVYGDFDVTENRVLECISEFVGAMSCNNASIDKAMEKARGDMNQNPIDTTITVVQAYYGTTTVITLTSSFNPSEDRGRAIFVQNCSKCHSPIRPLQSVTEACNGLDLVYADNGIGKISGNPADFGVFKSPSLRNIALTAPYMHDGRFKTLEEVVDFYSSGVKMHPNLHPLMLHNGSPNLHLSAQQKNDLIAFMLTFTDNSIASDEKFINPFR